MSVEIPSPAPAVAAEAVPRAGAEGARWPGGLWLYALHLFTVFGLALSNGLLGLGWLAAPWSGAAVGRALRRAAPLLAALGFYALFLVASIALSYDPVVSLRAATELFNVSALPLGLLLLRRESDVRRIVDGLIVVAALVAVYGLVPVLADGGRIHLYDRIRGPFSHYMTFAGFLLLVDLLLLASMLCRGGWRRPWRWLALVPINAALVLSLTRSAWIALFVALTLLLLLRAPRLLVAYLPIALVLTLLVPVPVVQRVGSIVDLTNESNYDRLCMIDAGLRMIRERPLFGIGPEMVEERYPIYRHSTAPRFQLPHLHNSFLQLAAERGLPALASYLALMALAIGGAWRRYRREGGARGPRSDLYLGVVFALLAFNLAGLFEDNWRDTEVQRIVLFLLAMPFCVGAPAAAGEGGADAEDAPGTPIA